MEPSAPLLPAALAAEDGSARLQAALAIGTHPDPRFIEALIGRCSTEPDFFVRDMLTWALTRHPPGLTVPKLVSELQSPIAQARSQALHTLSKIKDPGAYPAITESMLGDADEEVAHSAWRAAVILAPEGRKGELALSLAAQLGRGGREAQLSLSRAFIALGAGAAEPVLAKAMADGAPEARLHADATLRLLKDPDAGFESALHEAKRQRILPGNAPRPS